MEKLEGIPNVLQYDIVDERTDPVTEEMNPNFIYTEDGKEGAVEETITEEVLPDEDLPDELPEFVPKPKPEPSQIFQDVEPAPSGKLNKNGKPRKKRKPMTDHQKEMLKQAREKAMAKRKYLQEEKSKVNKLKKEKSEMTKSLKEEKEKLEMNVLEEEVKSLKKKVAVAPEPLQQVPAPAPRPPTPRTDKQSYITRDDLEKAQLNTLVHYEQMRKARKQEKKKKLQEAEYLNQVATTMKKVNGWKETAGPYAGFF